LPGGEVQGVQVEIPTGSDAWNPGTFNDIHSTKMGGKIREKGPKTTILLH